MQVLALELYYLAFNYRKINKMVNIVIQEPKVEKIKFITYYLAFRSENWPFEMTLSAISFSICVYSSIFFYFCHILGNIT